MVSGDDEHKCFYVYILQSEKDKKYYIGYTSNLKQRLKEHNSGKTKSLRARLPLELIGYETYLTKQEAYAREKKIKSYKNGNSFKLLIESFICSPPPKVGSR